MKDETLLCRKKRGRIDVANTVLFWASRNAVPSVFHLYKDRETRLALPGLPRSETLAHDVVAILEMAAQMVELADESLAGAVRMSGARLGRAKKNVRTVHVLPSSPSSCPCPFSIKSSRSGVPLLDLCFCFRPAPG